MRRLSSGTALTLAVLAASIVAGTALAITSSYRPIALWWVMAAASAVNVVRFGARMRTGTAFRSRVGLDRQATGDVAGEMRPQLPLQRLGAIVVRAARRKFAKTDGTSKAWLDGQNARFLTWFAQHNLLWTTVGFGGSLLLWHRLGPTDAALIVMAALMSCGVFAALGTVIGARSKALGLCWREPCRSPDFRSIGGLVTDVGTVLVLRNRHEFAATRDWTKGARFHELFLTIDELARAGIEPGLSATLEDAGESARQKLAKKERCDRALALIPVFAVSLLAALLVVPPLAGDEPLPSLWQIVTGTAGASRSSSTTSSSDSDGTPSPAAERSTRPKSEGDPTQLSRDAGPSAGRGTDSRVESPAAGNGSAASGAVESLEKDGGANGASARSAGDGAGPALGRAGRPGGGAAAESGGGGSDGATGSGQGQAARNESGSSNGDQSGGPGGRGGSAKGYGTSGVAPQRAASPAAVPEQPPNPGKVIEVVLPPLTQSKEGSAGDDPTGQKRTGSAPTDTLAYRPVRDGSSPPDDHATREPVQRWPNWVYRLLHK